MKKLTNHTQKALVMFLQNPHREFTNRTLIKNAVSIVYKGEHYLFSPNQLSKWVWSINECSKSLGLDFAIEVRREGRNAFYSCPAMTKPERLEMLEKVSLFISRDCTADFEKRPLLHTVKKDVKQESILDKILKWF